MYILNTILDYLSGQTHTQVIVVFPALQDLDK